MSFKVMILVFKKKKKYSCCHNQGCQTKGDDSNVILLLQPLDIYLFKLLKSEAKVRNVIHYSTTKLGVLLWMTSHSTNRKHH